MSKDQDPLFKNFTKNAEAKLNSLALVEQEKIDKELKKTQIKEQLRVNKLLQVTDDRLQKISILGANDIFQLLGESSDQLVYVQLSNYRTKNTVEFFASWKTADPETVEDEMITKIDKFCRRSPYQPFTTPNSTILCLSVPLTEGNVLSVLVDKSRKVAVTYGLDFISNIKLRHRSTNMSTFQIPKFLVQKPTLSGEQELGPKSKYGKVLAETRNRFYQSICEVLPAEVLEGVLHAER